MEEKEFAKYKPGDLLEMLLEQYRQLDQNEKDELEFSILNGEELPDDVRKILKQLNIKEI